MSINRIQTFNPTLLDESGIKQGQFPTAISGPCGTLYFYNESLETLELTTPGGEMVGILPGMWAQPFVINNPPSYLNWLSTATQQATTDFTLQEVQGLAYTANEDTSKLYTGPLIRQTNLGGTVNTNVSGTTLDNQGNPVGTVIITIRPSDVAAGSYTIYADNSGHFQVQSDNGGTLTNLLDLISGASPQVTIAASGVESLVQGTLRVLQNMSVGSTLNANIALAIETAAVTQEGLVVFGVAGQTADLFVVESPTFATYFAIGPSGQLISTTTVSLDNGAITSDGSGNVILNTLSVGANAAYLDAPSAGSLFRVGSGGVANAGNLMDFTSGGNVYIKTGTNSGQTFNFQSPSGTGAWSRTKELNFTGTGNGTHGSGMSGGPEAVATNPCTVSGSTQTIGVTLSGTMTITTGAGLAWQCLAIDL